MAHHLSLLRWAVLCILFTAHQLCNALDFSPIIEEALELQPWLVSTRRQLHLIPELGFKEFKTSQYIQDFLKEHNITYQAGLAGTGIVATLGSGKPVVLLRTDIDALPVEEPEGFEARSTHPGRMHACGHDAHMAMLLGAARLLRAREASLGGSVKLVFQPFEEGGAGADVVLRTGALDDVEAAFGMHVMPVVPTGVVATRAGAIMAGALSFHITVRGRGGHAALPHLNVDPIVAASALIAALQTLVSRETSPLGSGVVSVTLLRAGDAYNVIPDTAEFGGTVRALTHEHLMYLQRRINEMAPALVVAYNCQADVDWRLDEQPLYPPTINDAETVQFTKGVAAGLFGGASVVDTEPVMAGEDFAFYCLKVPCTFAFLGIRNETLGSVHNLHNPKFTLDESVLYRGAALHTAWALEYLRTHQPAAATRGKDEL